MATRFLRFNSEVASRGGSSRSHLAGDRQRPRISKGQPHLVEPVRESRPQDHGRQVRPDIAFGPISKLLAGRRRQLCVNGARVFAEHRDQPGARRAYLPFRSGHHRPQCLRARNQAHRRHGRGPAGVRQAALSNIPGLITFYRLCWVWHGYLSAAAFVWLLLFDHWHLAQSRLCADKPSIVNRQFQLAVRS